MARLGGVSAAIEPGVQISGHLISEEIGAGGYSRVFRATPVNGGAAVAVKVAVKPELVAAMRAEGAVLRRLRGARFVRVLEEHPEADPPYFILELCAGGDLRALAARMPAKRLAPERVLVLALGILEGVAFAHDEGVVHGDLKPENILLDARGEPKIADLGLSRATKTRLAAEKGVQASIDTNEGKVRGTFDYLAPEVRKGAEISFASDIYAMGVLLYELLVGERPYGLFRLPGELLAKDGISVPAALDRVIARALAHEPRHRYPDAGFMRADLLAGDRPLQAAPDEVAHTKAEANPLLLGLADETSWHWLLTTLSIVLPLALVTSSALYAMGDRHGAILFATRPFIVAACVLLPILLASAGRRRRLARELEEALEQGDEP
ncbi:MAG TPA: serine/threonine-protein kinase [Planctomycetota bacterium]|nr:serine/threonine-protein kinase [Planctomycetota bacterium]